jgi:hypothetical protein
MAAPQFDDFAGSARDDSQPAKFERRLAFTDSDDASDSRVGVKRAFVVCTASVNFSPAVCTPTACRKSVSASRQNESRIAKP